MHRNIKLLIAIFLLFPITCYAQKTINYNDVKIKFNIDETEWTEETLINDRTYIDKKWTNDCGIILAGSYDIYNELSSDELEGVSRDYFNYVNILKSNDDALDIIEGFKNTYSIDNWRYVNYKMKFIELSGVTEQDGIIIDYETYITINNGYAFLIQYMKSDSVNSGTCVNSISDIVKSAESTILVKEMEEDDMNVLEVMLILLMDLAITIFAYEVYPFIRVVLMKKKYSEKEVKKMALCNSIIIGLIFFTIIAAGGANGTFSVVPSVTYYYINKYLWLNKKNKDKAKDKNNKEEKLDTASDTHREASISSKNNSWEQNVKTLREGLPSRDKEIVLKNYLKEKTEHAPVIDKKSTLEDVVLKDKIKEDYSFVCSNCGTKVKDSDKKCPKCGESFEDEEEKSNHNKSNMDQKFSDLNKLKKLLDEEIITKEEFEREKKKILD